MHPRNSTRFCTTSLALVAVLALSAGCVASKKFVRSEVHTSSDQLGSRIDKTDSNVKEMNDRVGNLDVRTAEQGRRIDTVHTDLQKTNEDLQKTADRTTQAASAAQNAQTSAEQAHGRVVTLEENFQNRNQYTVATDKTILFDFNSAVLDRAYGSALDEVAQLLSQNPDALIVLEGRTDSVGNEAYNIQLGERRAEAVKRYLVVEKSVPMFRIHETSFGAARPMADNKSREGRGKNRAVAVSVLVPRVAASAASNPSK